MSRAQEFLPRTRPGVNEQNNITDKPHDIISILFYRLISSDSMNHLQVQGANISIRR